MSQQLLGFLAKYNFVFLLLSNRTSDLTKSVFGVKFLTLKNSLKFYKSFTVILLHKWDCYVCFLLFLRIGVDFTIRGHITIYRHGADLSLCYPLTWNVTLEYIVTHFKVLDKT